MGDIPVRSVAPGARTQDHVLIRFRFVVRHAAIDRIVQTRRFAILLVLGLMALDVYMILVLAVRSLGFALLLRGDIVSPLGLLLSALAVSECASGQAALPCVEPRPLLLANRECPHFGYLPNR
jgi:hypothetical protein